MEIIFELLETRFHLSQETEICQTVKKQFLGFLLNTATFLFLSLRNDLKFLKNANSVTWGFSFEKHTKSRRPNAQVESLVAQ